MNLKLLQSIVPSLIAVALLMPRLATAAVILAVDFNNTTSTDVPDTEPGFTGFNLSNNGTAVSGITISMAAVQGTSETSLQLLSRDRTTPVEAGALTYDQIYDDFIFVSRALTSQPYTNGGADITLSGLTANTPYTITLYAFDASSPRVRTANWTANGNVLLNTVFDGSVPPTSNQQYAFSGVGTTDAGGVLLLSGRRSLSNTTGDPAVFFNALTIDTSIPEPSSLALVIAAPLILNRRRKTL